jgi:large subunit ribosomal protein L32
MGVPKYKPSKSRKRLRRSHDALTAARVVRCGNCGSPGPRHAICAQCGHYPARGERGTRAVVIRPETSGS